MAGILYVVFNEAIRNSATNERLYKIGVTKNSVSDRYYGLGLKMPGKFETLFAYKLDDYEKAELLIFGILNKYRDKGEWFNLSQKELDLIKANCEAMGGNLVTDEFEKGVNMKIDNKLEIYKKNDKKLSTISSDITDVVDKNILKSILECGTLHVNDNIYFHTTVDILNSLFGKNYSQGFACFGQSAFWDKNENKYIWCAPLNTNKNGWKNTMPTEMYVHQESIDQKRIYPSPESKIWDISDRAIFAKKPNDKYRFVGMFKLEKYEGKICIMKRISLELHLKEWDIVLRKKLDQI